MSREEDEETKPETEDEETKPETENEETEDEGAEPETEDEETETVDLSNVVEGLKAELAALRDGLTDMRDMVAAMANQQALSQSLEDDEETGGSGVEYPEIDLDEIDRIIGG